jgi:hypothetical protein
MSEHSHSYCLIFNDKHPEGLWMIFEAGRFHEVIKDERVAVFTFPHSAACDGTGEPPPQVKAEYERLIGWTAKSVASPPNNIVEALANDDDSAFDQPCAWGHRVEQHAVYCHNTNWLYAPRKCRRHREQSWIWGEPWPHEGCPGFVANPLYVETEDAERIERQKGTRGRKP